ncbi:hypothetical protein PG993_009251 [Apiospora rasikravindrae]|uniref:Uncharacterized protein n=1 Tax=Apiospora rasikravindrae TaxID=990691 RepID=A0ABR1SIV5_9PEZI
MSPSRLLSSAVAKGAKGAKGTNRELLRVGDLQRDRILQDIHDRIADREFKSDINTDLLKQEVIEPVRNYVFDPQVQIRGILNALRGTLAFRLALQKVEPPELRDQIEAFLDGDTAEEVVGRKDFKFPGSHTVHHSAAAKEALTSAAKQSLFGVLKNMFLKIFNFKSFVTSYIRDRTQPQTPLEIWEDEAKSQKLVSNPEADDIKAI